VRVPVSVGTQGAVRVPVRIRPPRPGDERAGRPAGPKARAPRPAAGGAPSAAASPTTRSQTTGSQTTGSQTTGSQNTASRSALRPQAVRLPRMPFVLLVLGLLGGGLLCLLVVNTTLGASSFQIDNLQQTVNSQSLQAQLLQRQIATDEAPAQIAREACLLGMRPQQQLEFLDLRTHKVYRQQANALAGTTLAGCGR
jgi:hypothetical protein